MSATLLALLATIVFAGANVSLARGARVGEMRAGVHLSVYLGVPFFLLGSALTGEVGPVPLTAVVLFVAAGTVHFVIGRAVMYRAIGLLGASRATVFMSLST